MHTQRVEIYLFDVAQSRENDIQYRATRSNLEKKIKKLVK